MDLSIEWNNPCWKELNKLKTHSDGRCRASIYKMIDFQSVGFEGQIVVKLELEAGQHMGR